MSSQELKERLTEQLSTFGQGEGCAEIIEINNELPSVVPSFEISFTEAQQRIALLQKFVKEMMIPGQDYGVIPKCDKPTLFKPGAEKLCDIYGFSKKAEIISKTEDWSEGIFSYTARVTLISKRTGLIESEGVGNCNNREKKYTTQDPYNVANTILKMAKKRAFIDAVLSATRSSGLFSQDLEDIEDADGNGQKPSENKVGKSNTDMRPATQNQLAKIQSLVSGKTIPIDRAKGLMLERYNVPESKRLTLRQADDFIKYLLSYKAG